MNKKTYEAPKVTKVKLEIKQSILGTCNQTSINVAGDYGTTNCITTYCVYPT